MFLYSFGAKRRKLGLGSAAMGFEASGLIVRDDESETILVRDYYKANRPANQKHVVAIRSQITSITCSDLREEAESALAENSPTVAAERA